MLFDRLGSAPRLSDHAATDAAGPAVPDLSRRRFLLAAAAIGGGLAVGFRAAPAEAAATAAPAAAATNPFAAYLRIAPDNTVTVLSAHMDMGQGIYHGTATLVAEELGAAWEQMRAEGGWGNPKLYGNLAWGGTMQGTGGSSGTFSSFDRYRQAGAAARMMLVAAAAKAWSVPAAEIKVDKGVVSHASGRKASFGDLAAAAAAMPVPADVTLKASDAWTLIGNETLPRIDSREKSTGRQTFTIDVKLPGLLTAVMIHPPVFGAKVKSFDAAKAKAIKGVVDVVAIHRGVAVVADTMWSALKGREAVTVVWDETGAETRSTAEIMASYRELAAKPGATVAENRGDVDGAFAGAAKVIEARYEFPYLAHAALEPLNAVARRNADGTIEIWGGHQMPDLYQMIAAKVADTTPDKIVLHVMKTGGGFGRRAVFDADVVAEAVAVGRAIGWKAPVKVQWTREDDMRGGRYRPAYVHALKAGLDKDGRIVAWSNRIVGQSIMKGTAFEAMVTNGVDPTSVEGSAHLPYAMPNRRVELTTTDVGVPVLWWRAVGSTHTAYAVETFLDELAAAAGRDPVEFRLDMLQGSPRHAAVLKMAAEKAGWGAPLPAGRFRGVAVAESFGTVVAQVAELTVGKAGAIKVERVVCAVDCGTAVNPDMIRAQIEGGIGFGLGAILKSKLTLDKGRVVEGNFDGYEVLRIEDMPKVEVHILASNAKPTGVGEPGVPPIGPAVANAYAKATGKRIRALPFAQSLNT
ncbi:xanthine dehydrogenase family protein molybdopterin-binding subunit [Prosthecomicrobium hirschii]|uniref:xanthine dehydrogenase family protein molybdopterin-binding subunit n=1 Tax=Prosthecodimorpha hirschii TaxID=665126 RepID=UPI0009F814F1|nr:xanthine dehydrogenase family protein molybdopterin-binding subunit [Prosthecomicrobium hirschii]